MSERDEAFYRKWADICKQSPIKPLVINPTDDGVVTISVEGMLLLKLPRKEYDGLTAAEAVDHINTIHELRSFMT